MQKFLYKLIRLRSGYVYEIISNLLTYTTKHYDLELVFFYQLRLSWRTSALHNVCIISQKHDDKIVLVNSWQTYSAINHWIEK